MSNDSGKVMFSDWIKEHRNGVADFDLTEALREVAETVGRTGKSGSLTLTIKMSSKSDMLVIADSVAAKLPTQVEEKMYWLDLEGNLTRNNPLHVQLVRPDTGEAPDSMRIGGADANP